MWWSHKPIDAKEAKELSENNKNFLINKERDRIEMIEIIISEAMVKEFPKIMRVIMKEIKEATDNGLTRAYIWQAEFVNWSYTTKELPILGDINISYPIIGENLLNRMKKKIEKELITKGFKIYYGKMPETKNFSVGLCVSWD